MCILWHHLLQRADTVSLRLSALVASHRPPRSLTGLKNTVRPCKTMGDHASTTWYHRPKRVHVHLYPEGPSPESLTKCIALLAKSIRHLILFVHGNDNDKGMTTRWDVMFGPYSLQHPVTEAWWKDSSATGTEWICTALRTLKCYVSTIYIWPSAATPWSVAAFNAIASTLLPEKGKTADRPPTLVWSQPCFPSEASQASLRFVEFLLSKTTSTHVEGPLRKRGGGVVVTFRKPIANGKCYHFDMKPHQSLA